MAHGDGPAARDRVLPEALHIEEGEVWERRPTFTLDESEELDDGAPLLRAPPAAGASPDAKRRHLQRAASKFQVATEDTEESWPVYRHEIRRISQLAGPIITSLFFNFSLNLTSVAFVGRLGEDAMAVAVLAASLMSVTGFSVVLGLLGALDTLCGQAWGAKNYRALGVTLQKAILSTLAITGAICVLWLNVGPLLRLAGQDEAMTAGAVRYLRLATPALLGAGLFECLKRYLMAQGVVTPVTVVSAITLALAPLFNWLLIFRLGWGLDGAVAATIACQGTQLALLGAYVVRHERRRMGTPEQTWHGWSRDCLVGLGAYFRLAVPSTFMVCLEWWAYEACIFMAGWLPEPTLHVAAMGVMMQVSGLAYMLPMGLSCAVSVRVSNALGAGLPHSARRSAYTATGLTMATQASLLVGIILGRRAIGAAFTNIPEVIDVCAATFPLMSASMFGDGLNSVISGVLRGAGRQELGALLNLASYWGLGLPTAYLLAVKAGLGLKGLWVGLIAATSLQGSIMLVVLARFKWQREAERAVELAEASGGGGGGGCAQPACEDSAAKLHRGGRAPRREDSASGGVGGQLGLEPAADVERP